MPNAIDDNRTPHEKLPAGQNPLRVLIAGGHGYENMGDEAILAENIRLWRELAPDARLTVLSPLPEKTHQLHGCETAPAPREVFFNANTRPHYNHSDWRFRLRYLSLAPLLLLNAVLLRLHLPILMLPERMAGLLDRIARSDVLFLSGGGYLTGKTLSRLWDNMLLVRLAWLLGVPTIMSGQTVGMFNDFFSRRLAKWGFKKARLIYTRDPKDSIEALRSIGVTGDRVQSTFDDAMFLPSPNRPEIDETLARAGLDAGKPYVAMNATYSGPDPQTHRKSMKQLAMAADWICDNLGLQIAFVPTVPCDEAPMSEIIQKMTGHGRVAVVQHGNNPWTAAGCYRFAELCVAMKHHPIIFSLGGGVPTVGVALEEYYFQKNSGAMRIFGLEDYVVCGGEDCEKLADNVIGKIRQALANKETIRRQIGDRLEQLRPLRGAVIKRWLGKNS